MILWSKITVAPTDTKQLLPKGREYLLDWTSSEWTEWGWKCSASNNINMTQFIYIWQV